MYLHIYPHHTGSTDGHFALAAMMQGAQGGPLDVPGAIRHAVIAANAGHARSKYFLAHGLYDPESWLYAWGRQQTWAKQEKNRVRYMYGRPHTQVAGTYGTRAYGLRGSDEEQAQQKAENEAYFEEEARKTAEEIAQKDAEREAKAKSSYDGWVYDEHKPFILRLPSGDVEIPIPLGQTDGCLTALYLLQSISHMSGRTNDLMDAALVAYMEGEVYESLELYNEAAELGVPAAIENSAVLTNFMVDVECSGQGDLLGTNANQEHWGILNWIPPNPEEDSNAPVGEDVPLDGDDLNVGRWVPLRDLRWDLAGIQKEVRVESSLESDSFMAEAMDLEVEVSTYEGLLDYHKCTGHFHRMVNRRFTQLANSGDAPAKNIIAHRSLNKPDRTKHDVDYAASLLVYAAEQGDISSLMDLGWLFYRPDLPFQNQSTSRKIFSAVSNWEKQLKPGNSYTTDSTSGVASYLALLYCDIDVYVQKAGFISIAAVYNAFAYLAAGAWNDIWAAMEPAGGLGDIQALEAEMERIAYNANKLHTNKGTCSVKHDCRVR